MTAAALVDPREVLEHADALTAGGDIDGAIAHLEAQLALAPEAALLAKLGDLQLRHGRLAAARTALEAALAIAPDLIPARIALARAGRAESLDEPNTHAILGLLMRVDLPRDARAALEYAAAKLHDDAGAHDTAWRHLERARRLRLGAVPRYDLGHERAALARSRRLHTKAWYLALAPQASPDETPVLIVGMPRSGTTLVERIIGAHPAAAGIGESRALEAVARAFAIDPDRAPDATLVAAEAERYFAALRGAAVAAGAASGVRRIATKLPSDYRRVGEFAAMFPRARVVVCRRHPLATCLSILFQHFAEGDSSNLELDALADAYREHERWLAHWRAVVPNPITEVQHEALVAAPAAGAQRLIEALGLPWDPRCLDFQRDDRAVRTASAWQVKQGIDPSSATRWRSYSRALEPLRRALVERGVEVKA